MSDIVLGEGKRNRAEEIVLGMTLDKALTEQCLDDILVITPNFKKSSVGDSDTYTINYRFMVEYFGNVCKSIRALRRIMSVPGVVKSVDVDELKHQECLIFELFKDIEQIRNLCKEE